MKPGALGNGQFRRIGLLNEAISGRTQLASVDATDRSSGCSELPSLADGARRSLAERAEPDLQD